MSSHSRNVAAGSSPGTSHRMNPIGSVRIAYRAAWSKTFMGGRPWCLAPVQNELTIRRSPADICFAMVWAW